MLLCSRFETCGSCAHASCLGLPGVPLEDWLCVACARAAERRARLRGRAAAQARAVEPLVLDSGAAHGQESLEDSWVAVELTATHPSDFEQLYMERPSSPDAGDAARERRWVQRQRAITASVDAQRARDEVAGGARHAQALRRTALRTVGELRTNWEQLRQGVLSFPAFRAAAQPTPSRGARTLLVPEGAAQVAEPHGTSAPAAAVDNAVERSWEALAALTAQQQSREVGTAQRPRARAAAVAPNPTRDVGHLEHLAFARRWREQRAEAASRRVQRSPSPPAGSAAPVSRSGGGFRIPKRKLDT